jgi:hypothetical protein
MALAGGGCVAVGIRFAGLSIFSGSGENGLAESVLELKLQPGGLDLLQKSRQGRMVEGRIRVMSSLFLRLSLGFIYLSTQR